MCAPLEYIKDRFSTMQPVRTRKSASATTAPLPSVRGQATVYQKFQIREVFWSEPDIRSVGSELSWNTQIRIGNISKYKTFSRIQDKGLRILFKVGFGSISFRLSDPGPLLSQWLDLEPVISTYKCKTLLFSRKTCVHPWHGTYIRW